MAGSAATAITRYDFTGRNGLGSISLPGVKAGDIVLAMYCWGDSVEPGRFVESIISADDHIQQTSTTDYTDVPFVVVTASF